MRHMEEGLYKIEAGGGRTILETLIADGHSYSFPCGGRGSCGKCKVCVVDGDVPPVKAEEAFFSKEQIASGYRLACRAVPLTDCTVRLCGWEETEKCEAEILAKTSKLQAGKSAGDGNDYIAIDIGTTTIAVSLVDGASGNPVEVYTAMNRQRSFGGDVITRIAASCEGKGEQLQRLIREDLLNGIQEIFTRSGRSVVKIAIAGNTTMGHLLMGLSCETLGTVPFTPVDISMRTLGFGEVFGVNAYDIPVLLLPGISTYVGADITAGMLSCGFAETEEISLLIDLGTNGEMAVGNRDRILVTSAAAGPAFEGGNISCGMASVAGAVCNVSIEETNVKITTIADKLPAGICGTGAIAVLSELLRLEYVDETGLLDEAYFDDGFLLCQSVDGTPITFTQKDVRQMQLAKAAIRAGLETLLHRYGVDYDGVDHVYLAGGFGYKLNLEQAAGIGLLPEELKGKVQAVGNSSLSGARDALLKEDAEKQLQLLCRVSDEVNLSMDKEFQELYVEYMMFE